MNDYYSSVVDLVDALPVDINSITICGTSYTDTGGVARVIEQQAIELTHNGFNVDIYALTGDKSPPDNVSLHQVGHFKSTPYKQLDKIILPMSPSGWDFTFRMNNTDIMIIHRFPFSVLGYLASCIHDTKYVFWSHPSNSSDDLFDGVAKVWAKIQHYMETTNFTVRNADQICAVSEESRSYIESKAERDVIYVPNSVPESRFSSSASEETIEEMYDINSTDTVVIHVGRITPRKRIGNLIESFDSVTDGKDSLKLVLVGQENMDEYSDTVHRKAGDNVIFTGFVDDEILAGLYSRSDLYVTCSVSEGWGLPISEANRFGTPIVAFNSVPAVNSMRTCFLPRMAIRRTSNASLGEQ